jgi:hypothetical protein
MKVDDKSEVNNSVSLQDRLPSGLFGSEKAAGVWSVVNEPPNLCKYVSPWILKVTYGKGEGQLICLKLF